MPGGYNIDLYLVNGKGDHIFVEVKDDRIRRSQVGQFLDFYSAISNMEPPLKGFKLVIIGESIDKKAKDILNRLGISFIPLSRLGLSEETLEGILRKRRIQRLRMLTPMEAGLVSVWEAGNIKIVTVGDVVKELGSKRNYARTIIHRLEEKRWLERIKRGFYLFIPAEYGYEERFPPMDPLLVGSILIEPYYYSYATSNTYYGFTTHIRPTIYIATPKARRGFKWRNNRFRFVTISESKFFGYDEADIQGAKVNMASPEKSIVDSVDKVKYSGGIEEVTNVIRSGFRQIDCEKLVDQAIRMNSHSLVQRLGFLADFLQKEALIKFPSKVREGLLKHVGRAAIYLASTKKYGTGGYFNKDWNIVQNVSRDRLLSEIIIG